MKIKDKVLTITKSVSDEDAKVFLKIFEKKEIKKIEVKTNDLGASIVQILLCQRRDKEVVIEDEILQKVFHNVSYRNI